VTEVEYLTSTHLEGLYSFVKRRGLSARSVAGRRRLRLLACGCCRLLLWHLPMPDEARRAVDVAEDHADGLVKASAVEAVWSDSTRRSPLFGGPDGLMSSHVYQAVTGATGGRASSAVYHTTRVALDAVGESGRVEARRLLCVLLRDVFHYPLRPPSPPPAAVLKWDGGTAVKLAQAAYEQRAAPAGLLDAARLSVLADALEDAGCDDAELVSHLRSPEPHVRGCWAVDLVRGRS
jgi:hypothetical protein